MEKAIFSSAPHIPLDVIPPPSSPLSGMEISNEHKRQTANRFHFITLQITMPSSFTCINFATLFLISSLCLLFSLLIPCHGDGEVHKVINDVCKKTQYADVCFDTFKQSEKVKGVTDVNTLASVAIAAVMKRTNGEEKIQFEKLFGTSKAEIFHKRYEKINADLKMAFETLKKEGYKSEEVMEHLESALFNVEECQEGIDKHETSVDAKEKISAENTEILELCNNAISICQNLPA